MFSIIMWMAVIMPNVVLAAEIDSICMDDCNYNHSVDYIDGQGIALKEEIVVEVSNEEEFLSYPKNLNYKYRFIITSPSLTRAVCYMCGRPNMGTVLDKRQVGAQSIMCPTNNWGNDIFMTWDTYTNERCTACGYESEPWYSQTTYTAQCLNGNQALGGKDWVVKYEYTQSAGYNLHQSLRWWTEKSYQ